LQFKLNKGETFPGFAFYFSHMKQKGRSKTFADVVTTGLFLGPFNLSFRYSVDNKIKRKPPVETGGV